MPKGIPNNGINKGWFKKGSTINLGRKRPDMINNKICVGKTPWNKNLKGYKLPKTVAQPKGENAYHWRGGINKTKTGYINIRTSNKYTLEHRLVIEEAIGRKLESHEIVHHINGDKSDNRVENLILFANIGEHIKHHWQMGTFAGRGR